MNQNEAKTGAVLVCTAESLPRAESRGPRRHEVLIPEAVIPSEAGQPADTPDCPLLACLRPGSTATILGMGQVAALMVVMAVLMGASLSAAQATYHQGHAQPVAGSAPEPDSFDCPEFARILAEQAMGLRNKNGAAVRCEAIRPHCVVRQIPKYYRYTAYGTATVLTAHDDGTSIGKVNDGDYNASGTSDGSGSHHAWDGVEAAEQAMGQGPHCVVKQNALTLADNNSLMLARRAGGMAPSGQDYGVPGARGESYGRISQFGNHYTFTGRRLDPTTGLMHYRYRYYESVSGRFVGRDPMLYEDSLNLLQACANQPTSLSDPTGLLSIMPSNFTVGDCGAFSLLLEFTISEAAKNTCKSKGGGYIVQEITISGYANECTGPYKWIDKHFLEAFRVDSDKTIPAHRHSKGYDDEWGFGGKNPGYGYIKFTGNAKYFCKDGVTGNLGSLGVNGTEPGWSIKPREPSGDLPHWELSGGMLPPAWWNGAPTDGPTSHELTLQWRCCDNRTEGTQYKSTILDMFNDDKVKPRNGDREKKCRGEPSSGVV